MSPRCKHNYVYTYIGKVLYREHRCKHCNKTKPTRKKDPENQRITKLEQGIQEFLEGYDDPTHQKPVFAKIDRLRALVNHD